LQKKKKGWHSAVKALTSHQFGPGSILARCHMWVEFVIGFPGSPLSQRSKFKFDQDSAPA